MIYLLDTNILVNSIRQSILFSRIVEQYDLYSLDNLTFISEVTIAELYSLAHQFKWGTSKRTMMQREIQRHNPQRISFESIYNAYADLDAFSQGKHPTVLTPSGLTARNMGKNDLWIAATAYVTGASLVTTDGDFDHLNRFITIIKITP